MDRDRDAWIMAATLLDRHGVEALAVVHDRLEALGHAVQSSWNADDADLLAFWRQIARAILAIVDKEPAGPQSVH
jgi:hypothetical protein